MGQQETGQMIADRYQLLDRISVGGMGEVYRAMDTQMFNRIVAIKVLHQRLTRVTQGSDQLHQRFQEEARVSVLLGDHPNIIKIHDYGLESDYPYLVMEFLGNAPLVGEGLDHLLKQGPMPPERVVRLARQICAGLHYAHCFAGQLGERSIHGVIHRDIKPSNIFILYDPTLGTHEETVKILDFGIAKIVSDMTLSLGTHGLGFVGSLMYASPEQLRGKRLDPRSDVYSLGIVLYEMLTGELPLVPETDSVWAWIEAHSHLEPIPIRERRLSYPVPPAMEAVVLSCLAKDPEVRPSSMESLSQQLQGALTQSSAPVLSPLGSQPEASAPSSLPAPAPDPTPDPRTAGDPDVSWPADPPSDQVLADAASAILQRIQRWRSPRRRAIPWGWWIGGIATVVVIPTVLFWTSWRPSGDPQAPLPSGALWSEEQVARFHAFNQQRRAAVQAQDWQRALSILDQMIPLYPEQAVELYLYRLQLQQNLADPQPLGLSEPRAQILEVYVTRWEQAILSDQWQQGDRILNDMITTFPEMQQLLNTYREQLEPVRAAIQFANGSAAVERLDQLIAQYPQQANFLRRYRAQVSRNIRPSPTPRPLPSLQIRPTPTPIPIPTPTPTPIPSLTPLTVPTLQEPPNLDFVCRLQPDLSMCRGYTPGN